MWCNPTRPVDGWRLPSARLLSSCERKRTHRGPNPLRHARRDVGPLATVSLTARIGRICTSPPLLRDVFLGSRIQSLWRRSDISRSPYLLPQRLRLQACSGRRSDTRPIGPSIRKIRNDVSIAGRDVFVALFYNFMTPTAGEGPSHGRARPVRCANQHIPRLRPLCFFDFQENSKIQSKLPTKSPINKLINPSNPCELAPIVTLQTSKKYPSRKRLPFHFCYMSRWRKCYPSHKTIPSH